MKTETIIDLALEFDKINEVMNLSEHFNNGDVLLHGKKGKETLDKYYCTNIEDLKRYYVNVICSDTDIHPPYKRRERIALFIDRVYGLHFSTLYASIFFTDLIAESIDNEINELD